MASLKLLSARSSRCSFDAQSGDGVGVLLEQFVGKAFDLLAQGGGPAGIAQVEDHQKVRQLHPGVHIVLVQLDGAAQRADCLRPEPLAHFDLSQA